MDVKDILGLPQISFPVQEKNSQPHNQSQRKPDDISREVYALTGGLAPLIPAVDLSLLNKRPQSDEKVIWKWLPFKNSARKDDLQLYHWNYVSVDKNVNSVAFSTMQISGERERAKRSKWGVDMVTSDRSRNTE
ncbi:SWR1-complex protein 4-like [Trifolium pratense]|uniref:SWR1-complex protein 4-like n=1 Tax=Trifolium pratense TaxID=57577 RepID=A0A2K3KZC2_TRIPR|nr:SWR1-complex protein 4-like [Trifolium pratense]